MSLLLKGHLLCFFHKSSSRRVHQSKRWSNPFMAITNAANGNQLTNITSRNFRESCSFSNTDTVTCSLANTVSEVIVVDGQTTTTTYTETSSGVNASPTNGPLYFAVTITAGLEKLTVISKPTRSTSGSATASQPSASATQSRTSSGAGVTFSNRKWNWLVGWVVVLLFAAA